MATEINNKILLLLELTFIFIYSQTSRKRTPSGPEKVAA